LSPVFLGSVLIHQTDVLHAMDLTLEKIETPHVKRLFSWTLKMWRPSIAEQKVNKGQRVWTRKTSGQQTMD
jgi:hypothetical protein